MHTNTVFFVFQEFNFHQKINEQVPDVFESWEELALVIVPFCKEISDTFDISVKIPENKNWQSEHNNTWSLALLIWGVYL